MIGPDAGIDRYVAGICQILGNCPICMLFFVNNLKKDSKLGMMIVWE